MTATFGKLQHQKLTLKPGLNIIEAPNEWGKSTWCAFLAAMLYGLDTRAKSTKVSLADKEHYQPWSGTPMSGRIDLNWMGRDITIERSTRGRIPMGEFRAFETASGLPIPELTADNCGEKLVGVEQGVFRRAGFIRFSDLPVTRSEELSRRLNALVTTGDESGDGDRLAENLKDLKNRCRYNRTGLLPQAEAERDRLWQTMEEQKNMAARCEKQKGRLQEAESWIAMLTNHLEHLRSRQAQEDGKRVQQARAARDQAKAAYERMDGICGELPAQEEAQFRLQKLQEFWTQWQALQQQAKKLPPQASCPQPPPAFNGLSPEQAGNMAAVDAEQWRKLQGAGSSLWILGLVAAWAVAALVLLVSYMDYIPTFVGWILSGVLAVVGLGFLIIGIVQTQGRKKDLRDLQRKYGSDEPGRWQAEAEYYRQAAQRYVLERQRSQDFRQALERRMAKLKQEQKALCGDQTLQETVKVWQDVIRCWHELEVSKENLDQAQHHLDDLEALAKPVAKPAGEDTLTNSEEETEELLIQVRAVAGRLKNKLSQYQGRMEALGNPQQLQDRHAAVQARIRKLEEIYHAVTIAQANLEAASAELQRRFAPRIASRAQELMGRMTVGRYCRLTMGEDFSMGTGAAEEDTLHPVLWRSDGTGDQIYLALRLSVSETLTPEAPLILDDALVRFDDKRLEEALKILAEEGKHKQVILFTCQTRENEILSRFPNKNTGVSPAKTECGN